MRSLHEFTSEDEQIHSHRDDEFATTFTRKPNEIGIVTPEPAEMEQLHSPRELREKKQYIIIQHVLSPHMLHHYITI